MTLSQAEKRRKELMRAGILTKKEMTKRIGLNGLSYEEWSCVEVLTAIGYSEPRVWRNSTGTFEPQNVKEQRAQDACQACGRKMV